jgi:hypothetical protein
MVPLRPSSSLMDAPRCWLAVGTVVIIIAPSKIPKYDAYLGCLAERVTTVGPPTGPSLV